MTRQLGCVHHVAQLMVVGWCTDGQSRHRTQCGEVKHAMVRGAVVADKTGTVETENNW